MTAHPSDLRRLLRADAPVLLANADALRAELDGLDLSDAEVEARLAAAHAEAERRKAGEGT